MKTKIKYSLNTLAIISIFLSLASNFAMIDFGPDKASASQETNLITNPGFEDGSNNWNINPQYDKTVTVDTTQHNSGSASIKFVANPSGSTISSTHATFSDQLIPVDKSNYYELSVYVKGEIGNEKVYFGYQELDANGASVGGWVALSGAQTVSADWKQYKAAAKIHSSDTTSVKIMFFGYNAGTTYWDDFSFIGFNSTTLGCNNNSDSRCYDFSQDNGGVNGSLSQLTATSTESGISGPEIDGNVPFRELSTTSYTKTNGTVVTNQSFNVMIPAGDIDQNSSDFLVEIKYKDSFNYNKYATSSSSPGIVLKNKSPWYITDSTFDQTKCTNTTADQVTQCGDYIPLGFDNLGQYGNQSWQTSQTLFLNSKGSPKALKSIGGFFKFRIDLPTLTLKDGDSSPTFLVSYLSINKVTPAQSASFLDFQKRTRSETKAYLADNNPVPAVNSSGFTWFTSPSMEMVFPYSKPSTADQVKPSSIDSYSTLGETRSINFSVYTKNDLSNLQFEVGSFASGGNTISSNNLKIKKVYYEERAWIDNYKNKNTYGLVPDRLEDFSSMTLSANTAQQFYLIIDVPRDQQGGTYSGNIDIKVNNVKVDSIPVSIEILPLVLDDSNHINMVSRNPYSNNSALSSKYTDLVMKDMISHGLDTVMGDVGTIKLTGTGTSSDPFVYDSTNSYFSSVIEKTLKTSGINQKVVMFGGLGSSALTVVNYIKSLKDSSGQLLYPDFASKKLYDQLSDTLFIQAMGQVIQGMKARVAQLSPGTSLVLETTDEPGNYLDRRIYEDRVDPVIKAQGIQTYVTYNPYANQELDCSDASICGTFSGKIPTLAPLIDYKIYPMLWGTGEADANGNLQGSDGFYTTYYSQLRNPVYDRFLSGFYAEKLGTKVIYNWTYFDNGGGDPYNDFDISADRVFPADAYDFVLAYPTWDGKINDSTSIESIREGVEDSKYYATLERLIKERQSINPDDQDAKSAQAVLDNILSNIKPDFLNDYYNKKNDYGFGNLILQSLPNSNTSTDSNNYSVFDQARKKMFDMIKTLTATSLDLKISPDKKYIVSGGNITYSVSYKNTKTAAITNAVISVPVNTDSFSFLSVGNGGSYDADKKTITWTITKIDPDVTYNTSFVLKAR